MFRYWWRIRRATRRARHLEYSYSREIGKAKHERRDWQTICELQAEAASVVQPAWTERDYFITRQLLAEAQLLNLPVPDYSDEAFWIAEDQYHPRRTLSDMGITKLRKDIREERQARGFYIKVAFTSVVSAILAITALITAIAKL